MPNNNDALESLQALQALGVARIDAAIQDAAGLQDDASLDRMVEGLTADAIGRSADERVTARVTGSFELVELKLDGLDEADRQAIIEATNAAIAALRERLMDNLESLGLLPDLADMASRP